MSVASLRLSGSADTSKMDPEFQRRLANLIANAPPDIRDHIGIFSGYRDAAKQQRLFDAAVQKYGSEAAARKWVAKKSEHTAGFAADMAYNGNSLAKAPKSVVKWLHDNAGSYGLKFPLSNENWHIEPVEARASGKPRYDLKLAEYPGLQPVDGQSVRIPPADVPQAPSADTQAIQQQLAGRGFSPGAIDGIKGPTTTAAVKSFQQVNGLKADGIVGPKTLAALSAAPQGGMPVPMQGGRPMPAGAPGSPPPIPQQRPQFAPQAVTQAQVPIPQSYPVAPAGAPQIAPTPYSRPMAPPQVPQQMQAPAAQQLRLASGKTIAPGVYPSNDGRHQVQISNDGTGNAKITPMNHPFEIRGVIDPMREMNAPTLAGGLIRAKVPEMMQSGFADAKTNIGNAATGVQNTALGAVNAIGQGAQGIGSNIANAFSGFGNMFGGHVPTAPVAPTFAQLQAMRAVPQNSYMQPRQVAPVPQRRPVSFFSVASPPPVVQQRVAVSAPQQQQQSYSGQTYARAQDDLRNSGMINSFGMVV